MTEIVLFTSRCRNRGGETVWSGRLADQLVDVEQNRPIVVHVRLDVQDNARVFVIDCVDDGVVGAEHVRAAGRYRNLITHLERCIAVVDDHKRRIGKDLDVGYR